MPRNPDSLVNALQQIYVAMMAAPDTEWVDVRTEAKKIITQALDGWYTDEEKKECQSVRGQIHLLSERRKMPFS